MNERRAFWNEVAKYGLLLGVAMGASKITEQGLVLSGGLSNSYIVILEWLLFATLFFVILFKATQKRAALADPKVGFSFAQGINYMILICVFAAIPVSCIYYVYVDSVIGYDNYTAGLVDVLVSAAQLQPMDNAMSQSIDSLIEQLQAQPQASIISTILATIVQYTFAGMFAGLILAGFTSRKPEITAHNDEE